MTSSSKKSAVAAIVALGFLGVMAYQEGWLAETSPSSETSTSSSSAAGSASDKSENAPQTDEGAAQQLYNGMSSNEKHARMTLDVLPVVKPKRLAMKGYTREAFPHWRSASEWGWGDDIDASDCDAREATLVRDGQNVQVDPSTCGAEQGTWMDPYTGKTITNSEEVHIDHMVPLAAAWRAGADKWDEEQRTIYANSPLVLVAAWGPANEEKGDKGPEAWKPENRAAWCPYAIRWISVKNKYGLNLTSQAEKKSLEEMLDTCSQQNV